jgi:hypothetical protein
MPDFWPLIRSNLPVLLAVFAFVGVVQLVAFFMRRLKADK